MNYRPKIHCVIPHYNDSTAWYRSTAPIIALKHHGIDFVMKQSVDWVDMLYTDIVFLQRPFKNDFKDIVEYARNCNKPIWIDFDDDLNSVPDYNPHRHVFKDGIDKENFQLMISMANVVTVTTDYLRDKYKEFNNNIIVIPNAHNDYMFPFEYNFSKNKIVNWRGTNTHREDLRSVIETLRRVQQLESSKDWLFNFIGQDSDLMKGLVKSKQVKPMELIEYFRYIKNLNPMIQLCPLVVNDFNLAKSNISWIEGTYSGAVTIAPMNFHEFRKPGIFTYGSQESLYYTFEAFFEMTETELEKMYNESFEYIKSNLLLSHVNKQRAEIVQKLLN